MELKTGCRQGAPEFFITCSSHIHLVVSFLFTLSETADHIYGQEAMPLRNILFIVSGKKMLMRKFLNTPYVLTLLISSSCIATIAWKIFFFFFSCKVIKMETNDMKTVSQWASVVWLCCWGLLEVTVIV